MITIINPNKLTKQLFFQNLINYLDQHTDVTLRQIKAAFPETVFIDRQLENYINAGYICRKNRRYYNAFSLYQGNTPVTLNSQLFIDEHSPYVDSLKAYQFQTCLSSTYNAALLIESTDIFRDQLTLANYFFKLKEQLPLSEPQKKLYDMIGDVNPDYALKHIMLFLLKFIQADDVTHKRVDIFVEALEYLGYIKKTEAGHYTLCLAVSPEQLLFSSPSLNAKHLPTQSNSPD